MRKFFITATVAVGLCGVPALFAQQGSDSVRQAQQALKDKGYDPGPVDGVAGPKTHDALRQYQHKENLNANGQLGSETMDHLGVRSGSSGTQMKEAGSNMKHSYAKGGKDIGHGAKNMGSDVKHGDVVQGGKDIGKGVGHGVAKMGEGTGEAAKNAGKSVKNKATGDKKHQPQ
ncbi:MAG TPA: peptidoglycan-binding domain-containing protein [Bryobacteraceae bacterium]|jgi:peptidoglycan hydrolase-like protein with peptidoglycan-binding domain|nr:peptidoglycan-binding domain-containing protein [Bryobacteraceae bacterium]